MQINKARLKEIILEELKREMQFDPESALEITKTEQAIKDLKLAMEKMKMSLSGEWAIANLQGYPADEQPDMSQIEQQIQDMQSAVEDLEFAIQSEKHSMHQRK